MRTLREILESIKNNEACSYEETRKALLITDYLLHHDHDQLREELLKDTRSSESLRTIKANESFRLLKVAMDTPATEFLGNDIQKGRKISVKVFDRVFGSSIVCNSGNHVMFPIPNEDTIVFQDIVQALSQICRFNGHTPWFYSLAQHNILLSKLVEIRGGDVEMQLLALLYNSYKAYTGDVPKPFRVGHTTSERALQEIIYKKYVDFDLKEVRLYPLEYKKIKVLDELDNILKDIEMNILFYNESLSELVLLEEASIVRQLVAPLDSSFIIKYFTETYDRGKEYLNENKK